MSARRWFRRRRADLGWQPVGWQGWAITLVLVAAMVAVVVLLRGSSAPIPVLIAILAAYTVVARATGGSRPREVPSPAEAASEGETDAGVGGDEQREALGTLTSGRPATGSPDEPALVVKHLTKQFGERLAVNDVSFSVGVGEVFGFLGPNGAGKTTTVRMLAT